MKKIVTILCTIIFSMIPVFADIEITQTIGNCICVWNDLSPEVTYGYPDYLSIDAKYCFKTNNFIEPFLGGNIDFSLATPFGPSINEIGGAKFYFSNTQKGKLFCTIEEQLGFGIQIKRELLALVCKAYAGIGYKSNSKTGFTGEAKLTYTNSYFPTLYLPHDLFQIGFAISAGVRF